MIMAQRHITPKIDVPTFLDWAADQNGDERFELVDGYIYAMSREGRAHADAKGGIFAQFREQLKDSPCRPYVDSLGVQVDDESYRIPDVVVDCEPDVGTDFIAGSPAIVVEVVSPSSKARDVHAKYWEYMRLESVLHYLVVFTDRRIVKLHSRTSGQDIVQTEHMTGSLSLMPPSLTLDLDALFGDLA